MPSLFKNMLALSTVQFLGYAIPLLIMPYLIRVLGMELFGKIAFVQVLVGIFVLFADYGFAWSATRKISAERNNDSRLNKIFSEFWVAQWFVNIFVSFVFLAFVYFFSKTNIDVLINLTGLLFVISNVVFPMWLLQGLERMDLVALIQGLGRLLSMVLIFLFVNKPDDVVIAAFLINVSPLLAAIFSIFVVWNKKIVQFEFPEAKEVRRVMVEGFSVFFSRLAISSYSNFTPFLVGYIAGSVALANYNIADKVRVGAQAILTPISQSLFPRMSKLYGSNDSLASSYLLRSLFFVFIFSGAASLIVWMLADQIVFLLAGYPYEDAVFCLKVLSPLPVIIGMSNIFGVQVMLPNQMNGLFLKAISVGSVFNFIFIYPSIYYYGVRGAAFNLLVTEFVVMFLMFLSVAKSGFLEFRKFK